LPKPLKSIPINRLIAIKGTPLEKAIIIDNFEFIKTIACVRIMFPESMIRLSAGRHEMSDEMQVWCFMAGANSVFYGDILLTAKNSTIDRDKRLFKKIGIEAFTMQEK
jgi:biotin synthase